MQLSTAYTSHSTGTAPHNSFSLHPIIDDTLPGPVGCSRCENARAACMWASATGENVPTLASMLASGAEPRPADADAEAHSAEPALGTVVCDAGRDKEKDERKE